MGRGIRADASLSPGAVGARAHAATSVTNIGSLMPRPQLRAAGRREVGCPGPLGPRSRRLSPFPSGRLGPADSRHAERFALPVVFTGEARGRRLVPSARDFPGRWGFLTPLSPWPVVLTSATKPGNNIQGKVLQSRRARRGITHRPSRTRRGLVGRARGLRWSALRCPCRRSMWAGVAARFAPSVWSVTKWIQ